MKHPLDVSIENRKYTVIQDASGKIFAFRHGEPWRDLTGDKLVLGLAQTISGLREVSENALKEVEAYFIDWSKLNKDSPDYDATYKIEYPESIKKLRARLEELKK